MKPKVYLAGAIEGAPGNDWGADWRKFVTPIFEKEGWNVYDPVAYENLSPYTSREQYISGRSSAGEDNTFIKVTQKFINKDMGNIRRSDLVLHYHDGSHSNGSAGEITHAYFLGVPVCTLLHENTPLGGVSSWLIGCSSLIMSGGLSQFETEFHLIPWYLNQLYPRFKVV